MISKIIKNRLLSSILLAVAVSLVLALLFNAHVFQEWNYKLSDSLYSQKKPLDTIIILAIDDKSIQEIGRWPWPREVYVKILPLLNESRVVAMDVAFFEPYDRGTDTKLGNELAKLNAVIPIEFVFNKETAILRPIAELENKSETGVINIFADNDGIARTAPLKIGNESSFAFRIVQKYLGKNVTFGFSSFIINYVGPPETFKTISFSDVYSGRVGADFSNKIVLIGATAPDLHDDFFVPTSIDKPMAGVEVHASAIQTLLTRNFLARQGNAGVIMLIFIMALLTALALIYFRFITATIISAVAFAAYIFFAFYFFDRGIILNIIYPLLSIIAAYVAVVIFFYFSEGRERKRVKNIFSKYVSKDIVEQILVKTEEDEIDLEGEERDVTILFADIRGFTSMSENMKPKEVVSMLNQYLGGLTEIIFRHKGTLDKYIGDCSMAIFNAPLNDPDHVMNAILTGLEMRDKILEMQKGRKKVNMGIGLHCGEAVIGNMGSKERVDYTAIGDTVNTASRLCSKAEGGNVIISDDVYQRVKGKIKVKSLGEITVKGKARPIKIYNVQEIIKSV